MTSPLRVILFGYGLAARLFHVPLIQATEGLELAGVVTRSAKRQSEASRLNSDIRIFSSDEHYWSAAGECDIAVIATANRTHMSLATKSLERGLHVVVEKPVAGSSDDAVSLAKISEEAGRQVHVFQNRRWDSDYLTLLRLYGSGAIGKGLILEARMESHRELLRKSWRNSPDPKDLGGVLLDLGSHLVDQALRLMGPVQAVYSAMHSVRDESTPEDHAHLVLTHEGGATSLLVMSRTSVMTGSRFKLLGVNGSIEIMHQDSQEQMLKLGRDPGSPEWGQEPEDAFAVLNIRDSTGTAVSQNCELARGQWPGFYRQVVEAVTSGFPAPVDLEDVIANLRVLDAARESAKKNSVIEISPVAGHHR